MVGSWLVGEDEVSLCSPDDLKLNPPASNTPRVQEQATCPKEKLCRIHVTGMILVWLTKDTKMVGRTKFKPEI